MPMYGLSFQELVFQLSTKSVPRLQPVPSLQLMLVLVMFIFKLILRDLSLLIVTVTHAVFHWSNSVVHWRIIRLFQGCLNRSDSLLLCPQHVVPSALALVLVWYCVSFHSLLSQTKNNLAKTKRQKNNNKKKKVDPLSSRYFADSSHFTFEYWSHGCSPRLAILCRLRRRTKARL